MNKILLAEGLLSTPRYSIQNHLISFGITDAKIEDLDEEGILVKTSASLEEVQEALIGTGWEAEEYQASE